MLTSFLLMLAQPKVHAWRGGRNVLRVEKAVVGVFQNAGERGNSSEKTAEWDV